uniref:PqqD family protein n=1 Tax=uncultured Erythrobacter sp. TaxID=263913 RepID=UPI002613B49D|nr:PqqD family protein [uncultured Erythrobacter sp.]
MGKELSDGAVLTKADHVLETVVDSATILLSTKTGKYVTFNESSGAIWSLINGERTLAAIVTQLVERFDVEADRCKSEVHTIVANMLDESLVELD